MSAMYENLLKTIISKVVEVFLLSAVKKNPKGCFLAVGLLKVGSEIQLCAITGNQINKKKIHFGDDLDIYIVVIILSLLSFYPFYFRSIIP